MAKRFNNLDAALKYLRSTSATPDADTPDAPAGSQLKKYQDWKAGKVLVRYTRAESSNPGGIDEIGIKPFALPSADDKVILVGLSKRALTNIAEAGIATTDLNSVATLTEAERMIGFTPARATVSVGPAGTPTATTADSKITGRSYKKVSRSTYTYPFGRGAGEDASYAKARADILAKVSQGTANRSVSFKPEIYR